MRAARLKADHPISSIPPGLVAVLNASENELLTAVSRKHNDYYAHCFTNTSSVCLVAHVDTEPRQLPLKLTINLSGHLHATNGILGADDRAGVYIILKLLSSGLDVNVLFCNFEEFGGIGARKAYRELDMRHIRFFMGLDFRGRMEYAVYHPQPDWVHRLPLSFGYTKAKGTFTDIAVFEEKPSINLSVGYTRNHTANESLDMDSMLQIHDIMPRLIREAEAMVLQQAV
jgi:hypothetical protein